MSQPIVIPPVQTPEERFRMAMRDPAVRRRAANDPLYAARLREMLTPGPNFSEGPSINPRSSQTFARPSVSTTFSGFGVAPVGVSVSDQVRMQRDAFLVADGSQVTGNYDTAIRAAKGGIPAPRTPPVGSPSAFYPYPGNNMRTGAALAGNGGVMATETRGLLPTTGFNAGAFVATRPDSLNRTLATNVPVPMPRYRIPASTTRIITSSPSEERRRNISTLLGLGETPNPKAVDPRRNATSFDLLQDFLDNDADFRKTSKGKIVAPALAEMFGLLRVPSEEMMTPDQKATWGFVGDPWSGSNIAKKSAYVFLFAGQSVIETIITTLILAQKFDLDNVVIKVLLDRIGALKSAAQNYGGSYNKLINESLLSAMGETWGPVIQALGGKMPFDLEVTGVRKYMIRYLYRKIWNTEISDVIYSAVSSKLACGTLLGASVTAAIDLMMLPAYAPGKKPALTSCPAAKVFDPNPVTDSEEGGAEAEGEINMTLVKGGLIAAALLIGVGVYAKTR